MVRVATLLLAALALLGCSAEEGQDYGKEITAASEAPKVDAEAEIAKIQANEHMPPAAKAAAIANLRRGQEMAATQSGKK